MDTHAEVVEMLTELGDALTFTGFTIYGIPETTEDMQNMTPSYSMVESQQHTFLVSTKDCVSHSIVVGNTFTYTDQVFTYTFKVARPSVALLDGVSKLPVNLATKVPL